ncbi:MAG TPA: hypothetical protein VJP85_02190 [Candidatus Baltobacteraceae bacterium]|nr:hypothetical protein [Candidatus Baltobacteraceae bacterium]
MVEHHGGHVKPRLFALHEQGRLWYFDLCSPHEMPGDHWSAAQPFRGQDVAGGGVVSQTMGGGELFIRATGYRPLEFKAEFCARLAWALGNASTLPNITARFDRSTILEFIDDQPQPTKPDPNWPPSFPEKFVTNEEAQELFGATTDIDLASYEVGADAVTFYPKTISDIRDLLIFYQHEASNLYVLPFMDRPTAHISFELDDERWYINCDNDGLPHLVKSLCDRFDVELIIHNEKLADHRPQIDTYLRGLNDGRMP